MVEDEARGGGAGGVWREIKRLNSRRHTVADAGTASMRRHARAEGSLSACISTNQARSGNEMPGEIRSRRTDTRPSRPRAVRTRKDCKSGY